MEVDMSLLMRSKEEQLLSKLVAASASGHPTTAGDIKEGGWVAVLSEFLPNRYAVSKAHVVDHTGTASEQLDVVVHDRQYCPLFFFQDSYKYIPAESVYAVFEVKPALDVENMRAAADKARSVRALQRTSVPIIHASGVADPKPPGHIIAGILTTNSSWNPAFGEPFATAMADVASGETTGIIDLGCALRDGAFESQPGEVGYRLVHQSDGEGNLIMFLIALFKRLQAMATVAALDLEAYAASLA